MKKKKPTTQEKIELRSEKIRELVGKIPPSLVRWSLAINLLILAALACALLFIPSPYGQQQESILQYLIHRF